MQKHATAIFRTEFLSQVTDRYHNSPIDHLQDLKDNLDAFGRVIVLFSGRYSGSIADRVPES